MVIFIKAIGVKIAEKEQDKLCMQMDKDMQATGWIINLVVKESTIEELKFLQRANGKTILLLVGSFIVNNMKVNGKEEILMVKEFISMKMGLYIKVNL